MKLNLAKSLKNKAMRRIEIRFTTHLKKDNFMFLLLPSFGYLKAGKEWSIIFIWLYFDLQIGNK